MFTVTTKIPDNTNKALSELAHEINRSKGYIIQRAIEAYLKEKSPQEGVSRSLKKPTTSGPHPRPIIFKAKNSNAEVKARL